MVGRTLIIFTALCVIAKTIILALFFGSFLIGDGLMSTIGNYLQSMQADIALFGIVIAAFVLNIIIDNKRRKIGTLGIAGFLVLLCLGDLVSLAVFQTRFYIWDMWSFFQWNAISPFLIYRLGGIGLFTIIISSIKRGINKYFHINRDPLHLLYLLAIILFLLGTWEVLSLQAKSLTAFTAIVGNTSSYEYAVQPIKNIIEGTTGLCIAPTPSAIPYNEYFTKIEGANKKPNIILLFAEGLSLVDSKQAGGLANNTPQIDNIQKQGITFTNFMANGCTSDTAHIAAIQGIEPRSYGFAFGQKIYDKYTGYDAPLPQLAKKMGYQTTFVSTVTLDFLDQKDFIKDMGYQKIIGEEAFATKKKYTFEAAPDGDLYEKILTITKNTTGRLFLTAQTISFHIPFSSPAGNGEQKTLSYADKALGDFYRSLVQQGFFNNGILIIVGDHRKPTPIGYDEYEAFGKSAHGKVVATIVGTGIASGQVFSGIVQHIDIYNSIKNLISSGYITIRSDYNDMFTQQTKRNRSVRYCNFKEKEYVITMQQNKEEPDEPTKKYIQNYIQAYENFEYDNKIEQRPRITTGKTGIALSGSILEISRLGTGIKLMSEKESTPTHGLSGILLLGHGGSHAGATPFDSIESIYKSYIQGADGTEIDIAFTKDNVNILSHGPDIRSPNCKGKIIKNLRLDELKNKCPLANGEQIHTLDEVFAETKHYVPRYIVEIKVEDSRKSIAQTTAAVASARQAGVLEKTMFISYNPEARLYLATLSGVRAGRDTFEPTEAKMVKHSRYEYFMTPRQNITPQLVDQIKSYEKGLITYTPQTSGDLLTTYRNGARAFLVDDIEWAKEILAKELEKDK